MTALEPDSLFGIDPDRAFEALLDAKAEADYAASRVVPHEKVVAWLESWGQADELDCPTPSRFVPG